MSFESDVKLRFLVPSVAGSAKFRASTPINSIGALSSRTQIAEGEIAGSVGHNKNHSDMQLRSNSPNKMRANGDEESA